MKHVFDVFKGGPKVKLTRAKGLNLYTEDEQEILDMSAGDNSVMTMGWGHPEINKAITEQMSRFSHIDYKAWRDPNVEKLATLICSHSPAPLDSLYMCGNSGAEACETAIKMSFLVHQVNGKTNKNKIIGRQQSYHGSTIGILGLTDRPNLQMYTPLCPNNFILVGEHNYFRQAQKNESKEEYLTRSLAEIEEAIINNGPENISAFIGETIMGGLVGDVPPLPGYWQGVKALCEKYDLHLILDEVYCGTGTSGRYHCFEYDDVIPDFLMLSKTLAAGYAPLSAVLTTTEYQQTIHDGFDNRLAHSTTMQGYSLGIAAAIAVQGIITANGFLEEVQRKGTKFRELIHSALNQHRYFKNIRGRGLRFSVEHCHEDRVLFSNTLRQKMWDQGIYIDVKWHRSSFTPALIVNDEQIERVAEAFIESFTGIL